MSEIRRMKLLVADDHAAFRLTVRHFFEDIAMVLEADSGESAVALFEREHPDWVIMDLRMPGIGGLEATRRIVESDPTAKVVIISQFTEPDCRDQAYQAGAISFLGKENLSQLAQHIHQNPAQES